MSQNFLNDNTQNLAQIVGKIVAFVGADDSYQSENNHNLVIEMCQKAKNVGIDSLCFRRANGTIHNMSLDDMQAEKEICHEYGLGWIPYMYCYGPRFGDIQIQAECGLLSAIGNINGVVCADLESEWNGNYVQARYFSQLMRPAPCKLILTSFANPISQNFPVSALAPCVDCWAPQDYDNYLSAQKWQQIARGETIRYPVFDMAPEFGTNNLQNNASLNKEAQSVWLWHYQTAVQYPDVVRQLRSWYGW